MSSGGVATTGGGEASGGDDSDGPAPKRRKKIKRKGGDHRRWRAAKNRQYMYGGRVACPPCPELRSGRPLPYRLATYSWATPCRRWSPIFVSTSSCAPRVFRRASQGLQGRVVPLRGVQGKARSPVTYRSQQRQPGRVSGFTWGVSSSPHTVHLCLGVRGPASRYCVASQVV